MVTPPAVFMLEKNFYSSDAIACVEKETSADSHTAKKSIV